MKNKTKRITFTAIMIAQSAVFSLVPIPGFPTLSFDSLPGFFVALFVNPVLGGIVALVGHLLTSTFNGFPLGFPSHLIIAGSMFVAAYALGKLHLEKYKFTIIIAVIVAILLNVYLSMPFLVFLVKVPLDFLLTLQIPLFIASAVNVVLATIIYFILRKANVEI